MKESMKNLNFEEAIDRLESSVRKLEGGSLSLDDAIKLYEESMELVKVCHSKLNNAEKRIKILVEGDDGVIFDKPFGEGDEA